MPLQTCPQCMLANPETALRCDCGFDFSKASPAVIAAGFQQQRSNAAFGAVVGLVLGLGAIGVSVLSFLSAPPGGQWTILHGAAIVGLVVAGGSIVRLLDARAAIRRETKAD